MQIERKENGTIEVDFSFTHLAYLAIFGAFACLAGIIFLHFIEGLRFFDIKVLGLILAGVVLGIVGIIIFESSHFVFDHQRGMLFWQKRKYFRTQKGSIPFYDITEVKLNRDDIGNKGMIVEILTKKMRLSMTDSYVISEDYNVEELVGDLKSITGLGIDISPKSRAIVLLDLGQKKAAIDVIREEMEMSAEDAKVYLGIT